MITISVDRDLCQGHGVCESEAPSVFEVGSDHTVVVLDQHPEDSSRAAIEAAVRFCPTSALTIVEEE